MFDSFPWMFLTVLGPIVLAVVFGYALYKRRDISRRQFQAGEAATHRLYDEASAREGAPPTGASRSH